MFAHKHHEAVRVVRQAQIITGVGKHTILSHLILIPKYIYIGYLYSSWTVK